MYVAHRSNDDRYQSIFEHLTQVAEKSEEFSAFFGAAEIGYALGLLHDLGKYSAEFQNRILRNGPIVDHSTAGGQELANVLGPIFSYCIFGHHGGLPDGGTPLDRPAESSTWYARQKKEVADYSAYATEINIPLPSAPTISPLCTGGFTVAFLLRMLFSSLVDADYLDTEQFMQPETERAGYDSLACLEQKLAEYIKIFAKPKTQQGKYRNAILQDAIQAARQNKGLFSFTVPTGGGKTIASLAFALNHALRHNLRRLIYVIPYNSIIEQNAAVFSEIVGGKNVLEHHSGILYENTENNPLQQQKYLATENWDAPVVVTTNVQFFESLFASKTSKCRKLHNIAGSVIIFDEAQMIPLPYLVPCARSIAELVHNYNCTAVLCSATQPILSQFMPEEIHITELARNPLHLQQVFRRTRMQYRGPLSDAELAGELSARQQALCIVNTRKQAQALFSALHQLGGCFHLSTLMYPIHRKNVLAEIRSCLEKGLPCRVISTSLVEAGVDLDFPVVYRAISGLDSIVQAAGRCNREGKNPPEASIVHVFEPDAAYRVPASQKQNISAFRIAARKHPDSLDSMEAIHTYFEALYQIKGETLDTNNIVQRFEDGFNNGGGSFPFRTIDTEFKLIEDATRPILIPFEPDAIQLTTQLRQGLRSRRLLRKMGLYSVNVYERHFFELLNIGTLEQLDEELYVLADIKQYSNQTGLPLEISGGNGYFT